VRRDNYKLVWGNPSMLKKEESAVGKTLSATYQNLFVLYYD
jgi:hypothetical protein